MNPSNGTCMNKMQDGRSFTDYRPRCTVHLQTLNEFAGKSSLETRMFLMNNAEKLMKQNLQNATMSNTCSKGSCMPMNITPPDAHQVTCNSKTCSTRQHDGVTGIGTGRNYATN